MKIKASPFDSLLGLVVARLPQATSTTLVVSGRRVQKPLPANVASAEAAAEIKALAAAAERVHRQVDAATQTDAAAEEERARRRRAYVDKWKCAHGDKYRETARRYAARKYREDPQASRAKSLAWYYANRDAVLARAKAKRAAAKAALQAQPAGAADRRHPDEFSGGNAVATRPPSPPQSDEHQPPTEKD